MLVILWEGTAMRPSQMSIRLGKVARHLHTNPAYVSATNSAFHVVATPSFLDGRATLGAVPRIILPFPLEESIITKHKLFVLKTCLTVVRGSSAAGTDHVQTSRTFERCRFLGYCVNLIAVGT